MIFHHLLLFFLSVSRDLLSKSFHPKINFLWLLKSIVFYFFHSFIMCCVCANVESFFISFSSFFSLQLSVIVCVSVSVCRCVFCVIHRDASSAFLFQKPLKIKFFYFVWCLKMLWDSIFAFSVVATAFVYDLLSLLWPDSFVYCSMKLNFFFIFIILFDFLPEN
jgi:hypothetical protein